MTPLAKRIVKELTLKKARHTIIDRCGMLGMMDDIHCFECSAVWESACDLAGSIDKGRRRSALREMLGFLPAPKTWIEYQDGGFRVGLLLVEHDDSCAHCFVAIQAAAGGRIATLPTVLKIPMEGDGNGSAAVLQSYATDSEFGVAVRDISEKAAAAVLPLLAMINTPRVIGRTQHMPNRALERRLVRNAKAVGKFPLHGWTEIALRVTPPKEYEGEDVEAHLTGERARHFVRQHLRPYRGTIVLVVSHERGNIALGYKRSRYVVRP